MTFFVGDSVLEKKNLVLPQMKPIDTILVGKSGNSFGDSAIATLTIYNKRLRAKDISDLARNSQAVLYKQNCL